MRGALRSVIQGAATTPRLTAAVLAALLLTAAAKTGEGIVPLRVSPDDIRGLAQGAAGAGTSGLPGVRSTVLAGDPAVAGLYTIRLSVPPHQTIQAHRHRDPRTAVVVSGQWHIGYGDRFDASALKTLPPGSFYTEPAGIAHFARTGDEAVVVYITGFGPTDTQYLR